MDVILNRSSYKALRSWTDWKRERLETRFLHLFPLVTKRLKDMKLGTMEASKAASISRFTWTRGRYLMESARGVGEKIRESGLEAALLKGAALLESGIYVPTERPMFDVDILVRSRDMKYVLELMRFDGWREPGGMKWRRFSFSQEMRRGPAKIDVHWGLVAEPEFEGWPVPDPDAWTEAVLRRSRRSGAFLIPCDSDLFAHAVLHGTRPRTSSIWCVDAMRLAPRVDWDVVREVVGEPPLSSRVSEALRRLSLLLEESGVRVDVRGPERGA